jgi:hypothetical protein
MILNRKQRERLLTLACMVAVEAPARFSRYGSHAYITRDTVNEIRAILTAAGFDWRDAIRRRQQIEQERRRRDHQVRLRRGRSDAS